MLDNTRDSESDVTLKNNNHTIRLTASAICFQLGMGYGYTNLTNSTDGLVYNWTHPITSENRSIIWLDYAHVDDSEVDDTGVGKYNYLIVLDSVLYILLIVLDIHILKK